MNCTKLVAGIDSSTQSCTLVLREAESGRIVASASAAHPRTHPPVSEQHPEAWWAALRDACRKLDTCHDVVAVSVDGQAHGLVTLDETEQVVRPAKLWNDTTSAPEARDLVDRLGRGEWAQRTGSVPVASFTITKLLWLARHEPASFARVRRLLLPHDWITYRLGGRFTTDRSDASGTGYFSPGASAWQPELLQLVDPEVDWLPRLPDVVGPDQIAGYVSEEAANEIGLPTGIPIAAGAMDNAASALALGLRTGDVVVSLGTSGTVFTPAADPVVDPSGVVNGFADATGGFLPLVCTLNATKVTDMVGRLLGVDHATLALLALAGPERPDRAVLLPYLDGERTPDRPDARGTLAGLRSDLSREEVARAAFEGVLCGLYQGMEALQQAGVPCTGRLLLTGGGAASPAYRQLAANIFQRPVYVADVPDAAAAGAAIQAAAVWAGRTVIEMAGAWAPQPEIVAEPQDSDRDVLLDRYRKLMSGEQLEG